jgi:hypothetical protein
MRPAGLDGVGGPLYLLAVLFSRLLAAVVLFSRLDSFFPSLPLCYTALSLVELLSERGVRSLG